MRWMILILAQAFALPMLAEQVSLRDADRREMEQIEKERYPKEWAFEVGPLRGQVSLKHGGCFALPLKKARICADEMHTKGAPGKKDIGGGLLFEWRF